MTADPIAIVGMACRFGGAPNLDAFWRLLVEGRDGTSIYAAGRSPAIDRFYAAVGAELGPPSARGGFLDDVDAFDAEFFAISQREANVIDPQQRILLELTWDAFEDAGLTRDVLARRRTGVFVGVSSNGYEDVIDAGTTVADIFGIAGNAAFGSSGRLAFTFDLQGPEFAVNTGCAASLTAIHQARAALLAGDCEIAIAGGANVVLRADWTQAFGRAGLLSRDGRCKFGDASADGFVRSEGAGLIVLKRLADARSDRDRVYAVIRGSAVNNNGARSASLTRPSERGQTDVVRAAVASAGVAAADVEYVEAHGTGTPTGDPIELTALAEVVGRAPDRALPCRVGSVKSNIGHSEAAAGVAGVIKVALALHHRFLPPTLHVGERTPKIDWERSGLRLQTDAEPWETRSVARLAGVSSFGLAGANAHVVLEEAACESAPAAPAPRDAFVLALSARSGEGVKRLAAAHADRLADGLDVESACYTATVRRSVHSHRVAIAATDADDLIAQLRAFALDAGALAEPRPDGSVAPRAVMVFPGQGSQWLGMGRRLLVCEPAFRAAIEETDAVIRSEAGWSLIDQLHTGGDLETWGIARIQPVLFALQVALARLWISYGVEPAVCAGHSMGEVAAAHIAGALTLPDAVAVICRRSALMARFKDRGAMIVVDLTLAEANAELRGREHLMSVAASNGPRTTVLAGDPAAVRDVLESLTARGVFCRTVAVEVAAHSPQMDAISDALVQALRDIAPLRPRTPVYSTLLGRFVEDAIFDAAYWAANLRRPVLFHPAIVELAAGGYDAFIEVSPHPVLVSAIDETLAESGHAAVPAVASMHRDRPEQLAVYQSLGRLFERGFTPNWGGVYRSGSLAVIPSYPWRRRRFWIDARAGGAVSAAIGEHPLLGTRFDAANGEQVWSCALDADDLPWLKDHVIRGSVLLPAAAYVEIALAAAAERAPLAAHLLTELTIKEAIVLHAGEITELQVAIAPKSPGRETLRYSVRERGSDRWVNAASAVIRRDLTAEPASVDLEPFDRAAGSDAAVSGAAHAQTLVQHGYAFGPNFRCLDWYCAAGSNVLAEAHLPQATTVIGYGLHPALLDAAFQTTVALLLDARGEGEQLIPFRIGEVRILAAAAGVRSAYIVATPVDRDALSGDVKMYSPAGALIAQVTGLAFRAVRRDAAAEGADELVFAPIWQPAPSEPADPRAPQQWLVLGDRDGNGAAFAAALARRGVAVQLTDRAELDAFAGRAGGEPAGIVDFRALDLGRTDRLDDVAMHGAAVAALASALDEQRSPSRLWLITRGACAVAPVVDVAVAQASVWGLGAVVANERPELGCSLVDLAAESVPGEIDALADEVLAASAESRVALRGSGRFVQRLTRAAYAELATPAAARPLRADEKFDVRFATLGMLESAELVPAARPAPGPDDVEIAVAAAGVNFLDVIRAMGLYDPAPNVSPALGCECAGTVIRTGSRVTSFAVGDRVVALSPAFECAGTFTSHIVVPQTLVARIPRDLSFDRAAALPCAYLTCYHALVEVARMRRGESLLIHSASGGVGLAAIEVARWLGVEVWVTAGSEEKRNYLRSLGAERVMDSRNAGFGEAILAQTHGRGVDVVLNSLAGEAIAEGLSALAPYGRFLEIGKRDMWDDSRIGLGAFLQNRSFSGVDLATLVEDRPELAGSMLRTVMQLIEDGVLGALPVTVYPAARASDAIHQMAQAKHIGKLVLDTRVDGVRVNGRRATVDADATYLITGGSGALGLVAADALARLGARHLVLCGRSEPPARAATALEALRAQGVEVVVRALDVANEPELAALLAEIRSELPPLRGVIHSAGVLDDAVLDALTAERFERVMAGKAGGALALDRLCATDGLDFFVMFSSVAGLLGNPGQGNYAAANAMLDALAQRRAAAGRAATSIAWGPWLDIGLAAAQANRGARIAAHGLDSLTAAEGRALIERVLAAPATQFAAMRFDAPRWCEGIVATRYAQFFNGLKSEGPKAASASSLPAIKAAPPKLALRLLRAAVTEQLAGVLRVRAEQLEPGRAFRSLGLDSLMGLELRNRLERRLELKLSASMIWNYPTIDGLVGYLAGQLGIGASAEPNALAEIAPAPRVRSAQEMLAGELLEAEALLRSL